MVCGQWRGFAASRWFVTLLSLYMTSDCASVSISPFLSLLHFCLSVSVSPSLRLYLGWPQLLRGDASPFLSVCLCVHLSLLHFCLSVSVSICLSSIFVCLSLCPSVSPPFLSVCLCVSVCLSFVTSVLMSLRSSVF